MPRRERADRKPLPAGFWTIWSTVALDLLGFGIILPILALYGERFGAGPATIGLLVASFSAAQFVCAPLLGRLSDRIGRKPVILISLFGTAAGSLVTGLAGAVWVLFLGRIIDGASGASVSVAQGAVTDVAPPEDRARLLGLLGAAFGVGFVLGPALGGLAALAGYRAPFFVAAAIAFANAVVAIRRLPETHPEHRRRDVVEEDLVIDLAAAELPPEHLRRISGSTPATTQTTTEPAPVAGAPDPSTRRRDLRVLMLAMFAATAAFSGFEATFSLLGERRFGLTEGSVAPVFVLIGLGLVAVQGGLIQPVLKRATTATVLLAGMILVAAGLVVLAAATGWLLLAVALLLLVVGQGFTTPTLSASAANRARDAERGHALGVQQAAGALARIVGPALAGFLFQHVGIPAPYLVGAGLVGVAVALLLTIVPSLSATAPVPAST